MPTNNPLESVTESIARTAHRRRVGWWSFAAVVIILGIVIIVLVQQHKAKEGNVSYPAADDSTKIVYIINEPNPRAALQGAQRTMQKTKPGFSAVVFVTASPDVFPSRDPISSDITYLTAADDSTAIQLAVGFANNAHWRAPNRHLYYTFSPTLEEDSLLNTIVKQDIFNGRTKLALATAK